MTTSLIPPRRQTPNCRERERCAEFGMLIFSKNIEVFHTFQGFPKYYQPQKRITSSHHWTLADVFTTHLTSSHWAGSVCIFGETWNWEVVVCKAADTQLLVVDYSTTASGFLDVVASLARYWFLLRHAMYKRGLCRYAVSVYLSRS